MFLNTLFLLLVQELFFIFVTQNIKRMKLVVYHSKTCRQIVTPGPDFPGHKEGKESVNWLYLAQHVSRDKCPYYKVI